MKSIKRKLSLNAQTLRHLSIDQLGRVAGGMSSERAKLCSTVEDTGCLETGGGPCASYICPTMYQTCTIVY
jgi:hypothetical protein